MFYFYYLVENREAIKRWYINTKGRQDASCLLDGIDPASAIYLNKNRGKLTEVMFKEFLNDSKS